MGGRGAPRVFGRTLDGGTVRIMRLTVLEFTGDGVHRGFFDGIVMTIEKREGR